jgi:hypothetical protein
MTGTMAVGEVWVSDDDRLAHFRARYDVRTVHGVGYAFGDE